MNELIKHFIVGQIISLKYIVFDYIFFLIPSFFNTFYKNIFAWHFFGIFRGLVTMEFDFAIHPHNSSTNST